MNALRKRFSILLSENDPDYQFLCQIAISEINSEIELNAVFSGAQLVHFLVKEKIERELNRQNLPNLIIAHYDPPQFSFDDVGQIKALEKCQNIPLILFADEAGTEFKKMALEAGIKEVHLRPYTFLELKELLRSVIERYPQKRLTKSLFCCRCEGFVGHDEEREVFARMVKITDSERSFIVSRFSGPLCVPCMNQLRTSYRIIHGDFDHGEHSKIQNKLM